MDLQSFSSLLSKEVSRKEFLLHFFLIIIALTGISALFKLIIDPMPKAQKGFGSDVYGGKSK